MTADAIFVFVLIAAETKLDASRLLIPMSYAALISGMLTLIATTPNIVVHEEPQGAGFDGFGFFSFAPVGLAVLAVAVGYVLVVGRRLLTGKDDEIAGGARRRSLIELWESYRVDRRHDTLQVGRDSLLGGVTIAEAALQQRYGVTILGLLRRGRSGEERIIAPAPETPLQSDDLLLVIGEAAALDRLGTEEDLAPHPISEQDRQRWLWELGAASVLIHPESGLIGRTLREADFRSNYDLKVLGMRHSGNAVADFQEVKLAPADSLFVAGSWANIERLQSQTHDFVVLELPAEHADVVPSYRRMPIAFAILAGMVLLTLFDPRQRRRTG